MIEKFYEEVCASKITPSYLAKLPCTKTNTYNFCNTFRLVLQNHVEQLTRRHLGVVQCQLHHIDSSEICLDKIQKFMDCHVSENFNLLVTFLVSQSKPPHLYLKSRMYLGLYVVLP